MKRNIKIALSIILLLLVDQGTKLWALASLKNRMAIPVIKDVFEFQYLENRGAAFGILQNQQWLFLVLTILGVILISILFFKLPTSKRYHPLATCYVLFVSGAIGNFIDRAFRGYVVDFLYFKLIDFPIFNVADMYVVGTMILFIILIMFFYKDGELEWKK